MLELEEFVSKGALVEKKIKEAITKGELKPGQKLNQEEIAQQLGVSRTPVREAFRRLEREGFVRVEPCVGTIILGLEPRDVIEIYAIRGALEGLAVRLAVPKIDDKQISILQEYLDEIDNLASSEADFDYCKVAVLNRLFHHDIYRMCGNQRLTDIIEHLWDSVERYRAETLRLWGFLKQSQEEHKVILSGIREKDPLKTERLMQQHLELACQALVNKIQNDSLNQSKLIEMEE